VERLLQINVATMAALGTLLLGMGQRSANLPLAMLVAAIVSVWLTDVKGWVRLNRKWVNVAAVVAFCYFVWKLLALRGIIQLLAIGNFLVYLQIITLFQKKEPRTYGYLAVLSLVQVVVAALFRQKALFGVILAFYVFVGLSALVLLFLHRERSRFRLEAGPGPDTQGKGRRWPLAGRKPTFAATAAAHAGQGRELPGRVARMALGTLALALVFFFVCPRWGHNPWRGAGAASLLRVGFSDKVTLGELGSIIENPQEVLRIRFLDDATDEVYDVKSPVYLRGVVLTHYGEGEWRHRVPPGPLGPSPFDLVEYARSEFGVRPVRQEIVIEPMGHQHDLFSVWPFTITRGGQVLVVDLRRERMLRTSGTAGTRFPYELLTTAFDRDIQSPLVPAPDDPPVEREFLLDPPPVEGPGALPGLVAQAEQWVEDAALPDDDPYACARLLERHLRDSGQFEYSLEGQTRDLSLDPIDDFITKNRRGHCEYFATALTLMLRTQGIPARMIVGFKCDEWNRVGGFFQVRELHAHTWVEAWMEPGHVPEELLPEEWREKPPPGGWLRLDPTPTGSVRRVHALLDAVGRSFDWLNFLWANYVVEMDRPRQQESVYDPLANSIKEAAQRLGDPAWWREVFNNLSEKLGAGLWNLVLGLAAGVALLVLAIFYQVLRGVLDGPWWRLAGRADLKARGDRAKIEFYRRLEAVLAGFGITRSASQTQREFARQAGERVAASTGEHRLADLPVLVAEAFYRVRFGGMALDNPRVEAVEQALRELKRAAESDE